jgi:hypothetical protein
MGDQTVNLRDPSTFRYKGSDTDFQKMFTTAAGTPKQSYQKEETLDGGLQTKYTPYQFGNSPAQYYESIVAGLGEREAQKKRRIYAC